MNRHLTEARGTALVLFAAVALCLGLYYSGVAAEPLEIWIVRLGAPATSLFVILYGTTVRWWEFWIGRALMVSSTGMAAFCDLALANRSYKIPLWLLEPLIITVFCFISVGGILKLIALLVDKVPLWMGWRPRHVLRDDDSMR